MTLRVDDIQQNGNSVLDASDRGVANGVASLGATGKIPQSELPTSLMEFLGNWDASTNTPTLANTDTDKQGSSYRVSVAGTVDFGAGNITFAVGDWVYNDGTIWDKGDNTDAVASVNGQMGVVSLDADDIDDAATTNKFVTAGDITNLGNLSGTNTGDEVQATESVSGIAEIATQAEVDAGTDDTRMVTPLKLANAPATLPTFESAASEGSSSTTSLTYVNKLSHTTASLAAGTYKVEFFAEVQHSNDNREIGVELTVDAVQVCESDWEHRIKDQWEGVSGFYVATFGSPGTHDLEINYRTENDTVFIRRARVTITKVI